MPDVFPPELISALYEHLPAQRWFAGTERLDPADMKVGSSVRLWSGGDDHELWQLLIDVSGDRYQLLLGVRPLGEVADFLNGQEKAVLGTAEGVFVYDALVDSDMAKVVLAVASGGEESAARARPMGAEQSNTSIVYDDRLVLKVFRRLHRGRNPDAQVTGALAGAGFPHVPRPMVEWRDEFEDFAFGQEFLAGGAEGWALALTSLRDLYTVYGQAEETGAGATPADAGGDFAGEAHRLGRVTAEMHVALHEVFGPAPASDAAEVWAGLVDALPGRLERLGTLLNRDLSTPAGPLLERLRQVSDPGPAIRVHGDYHLAQVMRTDQGWFVLDFEGEPARPEDERLRRESPYKDVTGMLRSFHYASRHALIEQNIRNWAEIAPAALAWEAHNRQAFLEGYRAHSSVGELLPDAANSSAVMAAYELDKALYEIDYELVYRPGWVGIPLDAIERLAGGWLD